MEANNNYSKVLPQSNILTELADNEKLLKEYQQFQGTAVSEEPISLLSEEKKPEEKPKLPLQVSPLPPAPVEPVKSENQMLAIGSYLVTGLVIFFLFFLMFYPKTSGLFTKLGPIDSTKGIAIRGAIMAGAYLVTTAILKFFV